MKMRNLLRSIPFLLLMMSGLSLVFNCNGINSNSSQTLPPATVTVTFTVKGGNGTLTAKAGNTELTSPASVKKDTDVAFTPNPSTGYEVDYLLINGVKKSGTTVTVKADKNITAIVKFKTPGDPETQLFTVDYKAEPAAGGSISAKYSDGTVFSSGGKIETGTSLVFTAEPNSGYTISAWAGATESPDKKTATLTVTANSSVTVMFAENTAQQVTIRFNPAKMTCEKMAILLLIMTRYMKMTSCTLAQRYLPDRLLTNGRSTVWKKSMQQNHRFCTRYRLLMCKAVLLPLAIRKR